MFLLFLAQRKIAPRLIIESIINCGDVNMEQTLSANERFDLNTRQLRFLWAWRLQGGAMGLVAKLSEGP